VAELTWRQKLACRLGLHTWTYIGNVPAIEPSPCGSVERSVWTCDRCGARETRHLCRDPWGH
jgi:hypothetical protein